MTRYFCDICKKEINSIDELVCIDFNHYDVLRGVEGEQIQACLECANRAYEAIISLPQKEDE